MDSAEALRWRKQAEAEVASKRFSSRRYRGLVLSIARLQERLECVTFRPEQDLTEANRRSPCPREMPYRQLGRLGEKKSRPLAWEAWHLGLKQVDEPLSIRIVRAAVDRGINFMDNSWDYNEGASEIRIGPGPFAMGTGTKCS